MLPCDVCVFFCLRGERWFGARLCVETVGRTDCKDEGDLSGIGRSMSKAKAMAQTARAVHKQKEQARLPEREEGKLPYAACWVGEEAHAAPWSASVARRALSGQLVASLLRGEIEMRKTRSMVLQMVALDNRRLSTIRVSLHGLMLAGLRLWSADLAHILGQDDPSRTLGLDCAVQPEDQQIATLSS